MSVTGEFHAPQRVLDISSAGLDALNLVMQRHHLTLGVHLCLWIMGDDCDSRFSSLTTTNMMTEASVA